MFRPNTQTQHASQNKIPVLSVYLYTLIRRRRVCCWFIEFILQWNVNNTHPLKTMHKQTLLLLTISSGPAAASADLPLEEPVIKLSSSSLHPKPLLMEVDYI
jgi:hypothetical protein